MPKPKNLSATQIRGSREYPERPIVGVGGVLIEGGRTLLIRRGSEPLKGQWSIPGGTLETGETLEQGVQREMAEETGLRVRVLELIEVFERIMRDAEGRARYHFVIADYLCENVSGTAEASSDVTHIAWAREDELEAYKLTPTATRILKKAFAMDRDRRSF
jgi:mutator protein MutT